ncbi:MAG: DUF423 domain-containing protein [Spongiibacter marinus]|jgi:uncharacterized membrane protein YgdD (TMEM256/DUF423 family)|uniref:DUF423 domain-containing protein n=1 Tax=Spongiibacter marinus TaxID=354246 RepID=UPI003C347A31
MASITFFLAGLSGFFAVALGAFGAHGLKGRLSADMVAVYETAVQYHFYHTFALLAVALLMQLGVQHGALRAATWLFGIGIVLFSGSLYALSISGIKVLGAITPVGGLCFLAAWICLMVAALRGVQ